jgi:hypothetical protein
MKELLTSQHFWGILTAVFTAISLYGQIDQILLIVKAKRTETKAQVTKEISESRLFLSYCGYYFKAIYSIGLPAIDYYLLITRVAGSTLSSVILSLINKDRPSKATLAFRNVTFLMLLILILIYFFERTFILHHFESIKIVTLLADLGVVYGLGLQIARIIKFKQTGSLSLMLYQLLTFKEISTIALGFSHGWHDGWPLVIAHGILLIEEFIILFLFKHFKKSEPSSKGL